MVCAFYRVFLGFDGGHLLVFVQAQVVKHVAMCFWLAFTEDWCNHWYTGPSEYWWRDTIPLPKNTVFTGPTNPGQNSWVTHSLTSLYKTIPFPLSIEKKTKLKNPHPASPAQCSQWDMSGIVDWCLLTHFTWRHHHNKILDAPFWWSMSACVI